MSLNKTLNKIPIWCIYIIGMFPFLIILYLLFNFKLGVDPLKTLEHQLGQWGLKFLILTLLITPIRSFFKINLIKYRRALGLLSFIYICLHLSTWIFLDLQFRWDEIVKAIVKKPFITIGMAGFLLMIPLALTSNNFAIRILKRNWKLLHKLIYLVVFLGALHYLLLVKSWPLDPIIYMCIVIFLLIIRLFPKIKILSNVKF